MYIFLHRKVILIWKFHLSYQRYCILSRKASTLFYIINTILPYTPTDYIGKNEWTRRVRSTKKYLQYSVMTKHL